MATATTRFALGGWGVVDTTAPSTPTGLTANYYSGMGVDLSWSASTDAVTPQGSIVYEISRAAGTTPGTYSVQTTTAAGTTSALLPPPPAYDTYWYRVRAQDVAGNWSEYSTAASIVVSPPVPGQLAIQTDSLAPTAVSLSLVVVGDANADTFEWQRDGVTVQNTASQTLNDTGRTPGVTYTYRARGVNQWNVGPWSSNHVVTTPIPNTAPVAVFTATPNPVTSSEAVITLNGSGSYDPDGTIASYQWELVSGPTTGTFSNPTGATTTFTPSSGSEPVVIVSDSFVGAGADGTSELLTAHLPETGGAWSVIAFNAYNSGATNMSSAVVYATSDAVAGISTANSGVMRNAADPGSTSYEVEADIQLASSGLLTYQTHLVARLSPTGTSEAELEGYYASMMPTGVTPNGWLIAKWSGGVRTVLATSSATVPLNTNVNMRFVCTDTAKQLWVDDVMVCETTDNTITRIGRAGLVAPRSNSTTVPTSWIDNFTVRAL